MPNTRDSKSCLMASTTFCIPVYLNIQPAFCSGLWHPVSHGRNRPQIPGISQIDLASPNMILLFFNSPAENADVI
jgi:hypothetical protein